MDERLITKAILNEGVRGSGLNSSGSEWFPVAGYCEYNNPWLHKSWAPGRPGD